MAATLIVASSLVTVAAAGPILDLLTGTSSVHPIGVLGTLAVIVASRLQQAAPSAG